jgi:hypothetical protein
MTKQFDHNQMSSAAGWPCGLAAFAFHKDLSFPQKMSLAGRRRGRSRFQSLQQLERLQRLSDGLLLFHSRKPMTAEYFLSGLLDGCLSRFHPAREQVVIEFQDRCGI